MKMKGLLLFIAACVAAVASDVPSGPYPPSGWRPDGPALQLPQRQTSSQQERYLPPSQPLRPAYGAPSRTPATDLTVQGLPVTEQTPLFTETPLSGRQFVGRQFNEDLRRLLEEQRRLEADKQKYANRETQQNSFGSGQSESDSSYNDFPSQTPSSNINTGFASSQNTPFQPNSYSRTATYNKPQQNVDSNVGPQTTNTKRFGNPNQFSITDPTQSTTPKQPEIPRSGVDFRTNVNPNPPQEEEETTTDSKDTEEPQQKVSVEISKQMLRQLPENYPNQLVQLALQQQYPSVPFNQQIGQLQAPVFYQPLQGYSQNIISQPQQVGIQSVDPRNPSNYAAYDANYAQRQVALSQSFGQQGFYPTGQLSEEQFPRMQTVQIQPQYQQALQIPGQQASLNPYTVSSTLDFQRLIHAQGPDAFPVNQNFQQNGFVATPVSQNTPVMILGTAARIQNQGNQVDVYQSQNQQQIPTQVQGSNNLPGFNQQPQFTQQPSLFQNGFDVNQRGNGLDSSKPQDDDQDEENDEDMADVPAAGFPRFGERLPTAARGAVPQRPYGPPAPPPANGFDTSKPASPTDAPRETDEDNTDAQGETVAVATAVADGRKRKSRLRNIRPLYTIDKNGELVQLQ